VYLSVDALVNRGRLDLVGALLEANSALEGLSPDALKARKARQAAERRQAAAAGGRQIRQIGRCVGPSSAVHKLCSKRRRVKNEACCLYSQCLPWKTKPITVALVWDDLA
jgi:hypothetical protein